MFIIQLLFLLVLIFLNPILAFGQKAVFVVSESGDSLTATEGKINVPDLYSDQSGNKITLTYQLFKSTSQSQLPPIFMLAGGPGGSWLNTAHLNERFEEINFYQSFADVVIFDQRGAGRSEPNLNCEGSITIDSDLILSIQNINEARKSIAIQCRDYWLENGINFKAYNTDESANDIDSLRRHLGYKHISLVGGSYGSHLGLHYLRKFPDRVYRAVFHGIEGPDHTLDNPEHILSTFQRISKNISDEPYFNSKFENKSLFQFIDEIAFQFEDDDRLPPPVLNFIFNYNIGERTELRAYAENLISLKNEDLEFATLVDDFLRTIGAPHAMGNAMDFSSWISSEKFNEYKRAPSHVFLSDLNQNYFAKSDIWPVRDLGDEFRKNVISDIPVLLINGTWDLNTPIENAIEVHNSLDNSVLIRVENGSHDSYYELFDEFKSNIQRLIETFLGEEFNRLPEEINVSLPLLIPDLFEPIQEEFWDAVISGDLIAANNALSNGAIIDQLDTRSTKTGRYALNWAAWYNQPLMIEFLLENGADINLQNRSGFTPLHHAIENCSLESISFLLSNGANSAIDATNSTLTETAKKNCPEAINLLNNQRENEN